MTTFALDNNTWDLTLDVTGNLALKDGHAAILQDVASACRLFAGELWFDTTRGIPYFERVLGQYPDAAFLQRVFSEAAKAVPGVDEAQLQGIILSNRQLTDMPLGATR